MNTTTEYSQTKNVYCGSNQYEVVDLNDGAESAGEGFDALIP